MKNLHTQPREEQRPLADAFAMVGLLAWLTGASKGAQTKTHATFDDYVKAEQNKRA